MSLIQLNPNLHDAVHKLNHNKLEKDRSFRDFKLTSEESFALKITLNDFSKNKTSVVQNNWG
ncbi:hypothetical protein [Paenibacillus planticolens]|uniref:Uncharacterized protein n=1 Tax=Paenibacillus planticolens TaxID=2654976 RepID=A0ABX1ZHL4_9BACL|nr:hypothetical protein [Paenibacillus planticolens]NOU99563.1 hypothetical protein [Paenibacillus planticolens]